MVSDVPPPPHIQLRIAGFILILTSVFFAYKLAQIFMEITS
jgi:hypothetical protein